MEWPEFGPLLIHTAEAAAKCLDKYRICCHPQPRKVIYYNGSEFLGCNFQELLDCYGIERQPSTVKNPHANSLIEKLHVPLGEQLHSITSAGKNCYKDLVDIIQASTILVQAKSFQTFLTNLLSLFLEWKWFLVRKWFPIGSESKPTMNKWHKTIKKIIVATLIMNTKLVTLYSSSLHPTSNTNNPNSAPQHVDPTKLPKLFALAWPESSKAPLKKSLVSIDYGLTIPAEHTKKCQAIWLEILGLHIKCWSVVNFLDYQYFQKWLDILMILNWIYSVGWLIRYSTKYPLMYQSKYCYYRWTARNFSQKGQLKWLVDCCLHFSMREHALTWK